MHRWGAKLVTNKDNQIEWIVKKYVDESINQLCSKDSMRRPERQMPKEMIDSEILPKDDWIGWKPVPSTVTDDDLDGIEKQLGMKFPPLYRTFLKYVHFYELTEIGLSFCKHPIHKWRSELQKLYEGWDCQRIIGTGLIPFASETNMDAGPVCFDTRNRSSEGDCPIVFWDHEWAGTENEIQVMFSSSLKMFKCLTIAAAASINFIYHDEDDPIEQLDSKKIVMSEFLMADPEGAGGVAREYWTSWGVEPDEE